MKTYSWPLIRHVMQNRMGWMNTIGIVWDKLPQGIGPTDYVDEDRLISAMRQADIIEPTIETVLELLQEEGVARFSLTGSQ